MFSAFYNITHAVTGSVLKHVSARRSGRPDASLYSTLAEPLEVPVQVAAYELVRDRYIEPGDQVLDVGFGLGYGFRILGAVPKAMISGIEVDVTAVERAIEVFGARPEIGNIVHYDGRRIPFPDASFDVVTCVDVLEHIPDYDQFLRELLRVSRGLVFVSTPNRRPEYTNWDGTPKNHWHLREWSSKELREILDQVPSLGIIWHVLDGPWDGPFVVADRASRKTMALSPLLVSPNAGAEVATRLSSSKRTRPS
jgi:SAM-dependent methyltransferase